MIYGDGGQDGLNGDACRDQLDGDYAFDGTMRGRDTLSGGGGADSLRGGPAPDKLYGGPANDTVNSLDGVKDRVIDCDRGTEDTAFFGIAQDVGSRTQRLSGHFEPRLSLWRGLQK